MMKDKVKKEQITDTYKDSEGDSQYKEEIKNKMYHIIHQELDSSDDMDLDTDTIYNCVDVLDEIMNPSERIMNPNIDVFIQQSLNERDKVINEKANKYRMKMFKRVAGFLLVFIFSSVVVTQALNINLWEKFIHLEDETLELNLRNSDNLDIEDESSGLLPQTYISFSDALNDLGLDVMVPRYIPDDYILNNIVVSKLSSLTDITVSYSGSDDKMFLYTIQILNSNSDDIDKSFEKDNIQFEVYRKNDIDFYILNNLEQKQAVWMVSNQVYSLNGDLTIEQIKEVIDSFE